MTSYRNKLDVSLHNLLKGNSSIRSKKLSESNYEKTITGLEERDAIGIIRKTI